MFINVYIYLFLKIKRKKQKKNVVGWRGLGFVRGKKID
jgi:hypothetical protein